MARDYAKGGKGKKSSGKRSAARRKPQQASSSGGFKVYFAGVITGVFLSFLAYLATLPAGETPPIDGKAKAEAEQPAPKPRFDFYTMLPEQTIEVDVAPSDVEPARDLGGPAANAERYMLQAGSFRQSDDADRRRAELLLLGLEPTIQESTGDTGRWFRVYLGPFHSRSEMNRARGLTAAQDIDTLLLKRGAP